MSQAKERPILFSGPMVRALLDGRKTVTRRPIKSQPFDMSWSRRDHSFNYVSGRAADGDEVDGFWAYTTRSGGQWEAKCPYGQPGDRLWVRESFWQAGSSVQNYPDDDEGSWVGSRRVHYRADGAPPNEPNRHYPSGLRNGSYSAADPDKIWRARPSIHMPRWASRILLEITAVRVERLQDISEQQALAEGIVGVGLRPDDGFPICTGYMVGSDDGKTPLETHPSKAFAGLWRSINGAESWDANPWVWVIEFKRVEPCD